MHSAIYYHKRTHLLFLSHSNKTCIFSTDFRKILNSCTIAKGKLELGHVSLHMNSLIQRNTSWHSIHNSLFSRPLSKKQDVTIGPMQHCNVNTNFMFWQSDSFWKKGTNENVGT